MNHLRYKVNLNRSVEKKILLILIIMSIIASGITCIVKWSQEKNRPMFLMGLALKNIENNSCNLDVIIQEKGKNYFLQFNGRVFNNNTMEGTLPEYELEVFRRNNNKIYVKDQKDNIWKDSSKLGLELISDFVVPPNEIILAMKPFFGDAKFIENDLQEGVSSIAIHVSSLELKEIDHIKHFYNPKEPLSAEFLFFIKDNPFFIEQIRISFYDDKNKKIVLERTYFLETLS